MDGDDAGNWGRANRAEKQQEFFFFNTNRIYWRKGVLVFIYGALDFHRNGLRPTELIDGGWGEITKMFTE